MSDHPASLALKVFRRLVAKRPSLTEGLALTIEAMKSASGGKAWASLNHKQLERGLDPFVEWLTALMRKAPPPASTAALWFEVPEVDLNPAFTSVSAFDVFDRLDPTYGLDDGRTWPMDRRGFTPPIGLHDLPELENALVSVGWRDPATTPERIGSLTPGAFALTFSYVTLLVLHGLPHAPIDPMLQNKEGVVAVVGWYCGDAFPLGVLSPSGWTPIRMPTKAERAARPSKYALDPDGPSFEPDAYVRHGGDINARDPKGRTVLMRQNLADLHVIQRIVNLGADVNARDKNGATTLSRFVGGDPEVLELLLQAGADVSKGGRPGIGLFELAIENARCTRRNLELLVERGQSPHFTTREGRNAFHSASWGGCYSPTEVRRRRAIVEYLVSLGVDANKRDKAGISPLWVPLIQHIEELDDIKGWFTGRFVPEPRTVYFRRCERTAMLLLEVGADPNARLSRSPHQRIPAGAAPLMLARYDRPDLHKTLLKYGANPHAVSAKGKTALDYARAAARSKRCDREGAAQVAVMLERAMKRTARATTNSRKPGSRG